MKENITRVKVTDHNQKVNQILCTNCRYPYPESGAPYRCPKCGGVFDYSDDFQFPLDEIERSQPGIWRFRRAFDSLMNVTPISLGEGNTPLVADRVGGHEVFHKLEYLNPTGSFKDRGSSLVMSFLRHRGISEAVEDSSGNAGASFAAYAARAGIKGRVYIPDSASGAKRAQIEAYGVQVVRILGPRSNAAEAVQKSAASGSVYASHAYLPFYLAGYATLAYEIFQQLGDSPGSVICPVGQGGLLLGVYRGFKALKRQNLIAEIPQLFGVQSLSCAPIWALAEYGPAGLAWASEGETLAEGIRVLHPIRGDAVLTSINDSRGRMMVVDEEEILPARDELARRGFYVEPTSAVVWPVAVKNLSSIPGPIVLLLTGSGLKFNSVS